MNIDIYINQARRDRGERREAFNVFSHQDQILTYNHYKFFSAKIKNTENEEFREKTRNPKHNF